ncbi:hypothetical protein VB773_05810 [Haloarculaceae archaeon H-GB2-1]|nr:hypothetical protein [Haloarculaceae archaeon H-GB1-1]MEA5389080.1 hypothetical protein [Haloarculaceae archaeon H-GB11]MEA5407142.1 hypothetical protein [Haloarculaceae archaeon H-GB2-1]
MRRRRYLAALGVTASLGLAGCRVAEQPTPTETPTETERPPTTTPQPMRLQNGSFEDGLDGWTVGKDLPEDPNSDGLVETEARPVNADDPDAPAAADGDHALSLYIDGRQDDGTLWVQQDVDLSEYDSLALDVHSDSESFTVVTRVAAYAGPRTDLVEGTFDTTQAVENHEGWATYEYPVDHDGPGIVAVGISVVWESEVTRYLDAVRLS